MDMVLFRFLFDCSRASAALITTRLAAGVEGTSTEGLKKHVEVEEPESNELKLAAWVIFRFLFPAAGTTAAGIAVTAQL